MFIQGNDTNLQLLKSKINENPIENNIDLLSKCQNNNHLNYYFLPCAEKFTQNDNLSNDSCS